MLGRLYHINDLRREGGFSILYGAMNLGSILGPITYGIMFSIGYWQDAFLIGAIMELISLVLFIQFRAQTQSLKPICEQKPRTLFSMALLSTPIIAISLTVIALLLLHPEFFNIAFWILTAGIGIFVIYLCFTLPIHLRNNLLFLISLLVAAVLYFACDIQVSSSLILFIDAFVPLSLFSWKIPPQVYVSLEPIFYILLMPFFGLIWKRYSTHQIRLLSWRAITGLILAGVGFLCFGLSAQLAAQSIYASVMLIVLANLLLGAGELCIGPAITSSITYLIPHNLQSTFMGIWWFSVSFSYYVSNLVVAKVISHQAEGITSIDTYESTFIRIGILIMGIGCTYLALAKGFTWVLSSIKSHSDNLR